MMRSKRGDRGFFPRGAARGALVAVLGVLLWPFPAPAAEAAPPPPLEARLQSGPSLAELVRYAYEANPSLEAARSAWDAALARTRFERAYSDPALALTWDTKSTDDFDAAMWGVMLSQAVPLPGKLAAVGRARGSAEEIARLEYERAARDVVLRVREAYHELRYIGEARRIAAETRELLALVRRAGETAYARDRAALAELLKAESQEAQVRYDELLLGELEATERSRLNALLSRPVDAAIGPLAAPPPESLSWGREEILRSAESRREEVRIAEAEFRRSQAEEAIAAAENRPELMLGLGYESEAAAVEGDPRMDRYTLQFGFTLPLWPGKRAGRREAARAERSRAASGRAAALNEVRAEVLEVYFRLNNARRLVELYGGSLLPQAAKAMELADTWYREGAGSYADYVETVAVWYNFQLALARAGADHGKYLARLEALAGRRLTGEPAGASIAPGGSLP